MNQLKEFYRLLTHSFRNLLPIILVVGFFQFAVMQQVPEGLGSMIMGLLIVVVGVALFLQGLEMGIFPIGKNLSNEFAKKGSLLWLMVFGFCLGFAAVIAEPALIAVASQAEFISEGRIQAFTLRVLVATSVGFVVALGVVRIVLGHSLHWYMIIGYLLVVAVTFFAPEEIVGLAYDSGGVTTNIVTVPLIAALGIGLAVSLRGRNALTHGFGLVALAVMVPMIVVQIYGILVFSFADPDLLNGAVAPMADTATLDEVAAPVAGSVLLGMLKDLLVMFRDVLPIIAVVLIFQYLVIRKHIAHVHKVFGGFVLVIFGLYAFVVGLKLGLFPIGQSMAEQLIALDRIFFIYLFAFTIGFATTMAEPALIAIGQKAEEAGKGRLNGNTIRILVAIGVAVGITVGVHRIIAGDSIHHYIMGGYALVILLTWLAPKYIVALAYDLGGVTTSEVTVPLVTALGIGLATHIEGRNVLIDGFGLIAFASIFPIISVMLYAIAVELTTRWREAQS
ncbi:DUF1538 domain-containing protein [Ectothiorhodospira lacustris]|uniref:DUF1538 domain-containing protein n=1 Tax=Ectothiorhodospira lacustris TaxID=2899127 RepID=UPI001EE823E3|nr:DUF1538 domain-containing protein [Ectothiorhodospira lacustris]MCG5500595.1 DUF1538 domain-containing protein [Ectothiorhodospira lacustris]MCG5508788.1 DUF1538 domain-containing protein [Ectothiorhodospira lacustris]MCG5520579.1 DUF1538 domain-containing protein [Ectothiorhodospira lacustris]